MRISDIKGEKAFTIIADVMDLASELSKDKRFDKVVKELRGCKDTEKEAFATLCKAAPLIRDEKYYKRVISILATASGVDEKEYAENGDVLGDIMELLTSDLGIMRFFDSASETGE